MDASAAPVCANVGMIELTEIQMPPRAASAARAVAIAGTRELVREETLTALVALLVANEVVLAEQASAMLMGLSDRLTDHAAGHPEFVVHEGELRMQADRLRQKAGELRGAES